ncbi:hypothetical protein [Aureimonas leprariae]|uniref:Uncharacterized protein n=1 Tax=Plantimonas leprariae TaxID=2615207 RepID=A0A7V7PLD7_9HYPH|nr:hypothetical protein [Aureimonas leprariae]KAB0677199.1 hypothetical protein F6X38_18935 [Aureimonas leprariae]
MRYLIVAAALALTAPLGLGATAAQADTTKIIVKDGHRDGYRDSHRTVRRVVERRDYGRHCMTKKVVTRVHGERIVKTTRVCR